MPKILLALDASTRLERLLPAAFLLASEQHSALLGVFAQDSEVLQGAALPFTTEVGANSAACYPLTADSMANRMRRIAEDMRRQLVAAAELHQVPCEFQICCGSISKIASETKADVVLPGWNAIWSLARTSGGLPKRKASGNPVIVVVDEGSTSSARVIDAARRLTTSAAPHQLVIMATPGAAELSRTESGAVAGQTTAEAVMRVASTEQMISQICRLGPTVLLLGRDQNLAEISLLHRKLALIKCPLALVQPTW